MIKKQEDRRKVVVLYHLFKTEGTLGIAVCFSFSFFSLFFNVTFNSTVFFQVCLIWFGIQKHIGKLPIISLF